MNTRIKYCLTFIFLCGIFSISVSVAQQSVKSSAKADSLFAAGNFFEASVCYEEALFFNRGELREYELNLKKAYCYKFLERYEDCLNQLDQINLVSVSDTVRKNIIYEQAVCNYLTENMQRALMKVVQFRQLGMMPATNPTYFGIKTLEILVLNETRQWEEAERCALNFIEEISTDESTKSKLTGMIENLYKKKNLPKELKSKKAKDLSRFVPGLGQLYCGKVKEGLVSFVVNASFLCFGLHQLYYQYYFTAYMAGFSVFSKTYFGGMHRCEILAQSQNELNMKTFNADCLEILGNLYPDNSIGQ